MINFDPAAVFLLDMQWPNIFEPASARPTSTDYRCKGCRTIVPARDRERHYNRHKDAQEKSEQAKRERISRERIERLAQARAARAA